MIRTLWAVRAFLAWRCASRLAASRPHRAASSDPARVSPIPESRAGEPLVAVVRRPVVARPVPAELRRLSAGPTVSARRSVFFVIPRGRSAFSAWSTSIATTARVARAACANRRFNAATVWIASTRRTVESSAIKPRAIASSASPRPTAPPASVRTGGARRRRAAPAARPTAAPLATAVCSRAALRRPADR